MSNTLQFSSMDKISLMGVPVGTYMAIGVTAFVLAAATIYETQQPSSSSKSSTPASPVSIPAAPTPAPAAAPAAAPSSPAPTGGSKRKTKRSHKSKQAKTRKH
jgi:hypothetical protein